MRMKFISVLMLSVVLLSGCFNASPSGKDRSGLGSQSYVQLLINWDTLEAETPAIPVAPLSFSAFSQSEGDQVTIIGARVVAPDINAVLAQSATRQTAETRGVITIPVPATTNANLYAVGINDDGEAILFGYLTGLSIAESTVLTVTTDDLTWITPDAHFTGDVHWEVRGPEETLVVDTYIDPDHLAASNYLFPPPEIANIDYGEDFFYLAKVYIRVTDPFHTTPEQKMVCMSGQSVESPCHSSADLERDENWVTLAMYCYPGQSPPCFARPYVEPSSFQLPGGTGFFGPRFGPIGVHGIDQ